MGGNNAPAGSTRVERISFQAEVTAQTAFEAQPLATDPVSVRFGDGSPQIITNVDTNDFDLAAGVYQLSSLVHIPNNSPQNAKLNLVVRDASDDSEIERFASNRGNLGSPDYLAVSGVLYLSQATTVNINVVRVGGSNFGLNANWWVDLARFGGGVTGFSPGRIGEATFDLDGTASNVQLMDDTTNTPIVCPSEGWIISVITAPGVGLNGAVVWTLASDLRRATEDESLTAALYTNAANQIFFQAARQDGGATMGNKVILFHTGTITESSGGAAPVVNPSILQFDVTGDSQVTTADISGKRYSYISRISQSSHVGAARIVGFPGTAANPSNVSTLKDIASDKFVRDEGTFDLPPSTMLANEGDIYTVREEVYPTGVAVTTAPSIYHDFRIRRVAPAASVHFGSIPWRRSDGTTPTDASDLADFTGDFSTAVAAAGDWTITGLTRGDGERRLYWAVPADAMQPATWINSGNDVTDIIDVPSAAQIINGVSYRVYVTNTQFDDFANGTTYTVRS